MQGGIIEKGRSFQVEAFNKKNVIRGLRKCIQPYFWK